MYEPWKHVKWNKPVTKGQISWFHSYEVPRIDKFVESESTVVIAKGWGEAGGELLFNGYGVLVWDDEEVLGMDSGDGYTILWMHLKRHWVAHFKNG